MTGRITRRTLGLGSLGALALLSAAPARAAGKVTVGSKPDTEGSLLGNVILALLGARGIPTQSRIGLGPTKIIRAAILSGEVDIYPEYTGNGAYFFQMESDPVWKDPKQGYETVRRLDLEKNHLVWLTPAPADNTWAIAVRKEVAAKNNLSTMEDFARWAKGGGEVKLAGSAEFVESPLALPAFEKAYGFQLSSGQVLTLAGGNTAATERAAAEGTSGVNACMAYGTDGELAALGLVVMQDDRHAQMVFEPTPVVRDATLKQYPAIRDALDPAFAKLDAAALRKLNARIAVDGEDPAKVAGDWLKSAGLLK